MEADGLPGDVDGRRRGDVEDALGRLPPVPSLRRQHGARRPGRHGRPAAAAARVAGREVSRLRDGAMSLALLDERLVGGTGTAEERGSRGREE